MRLSHLFEAGIKTAQIDKLAREALGKAIPAAVKEVIAKTEADMPPRKKRGDPGYEYDDVGERYEELSQIFRGDQRALVEPMLERFSAVLTGVVRDYVAEIMSGIPYILDLLKDQPGKTVADMARHYKVTIEARELSDDEYADKAGGYMGYSDMKVFVDQEKVYEAGMDLIMQEMVDEAEDGFNRMLNAIVPIFTHEYAHLEQSLRRGGTTWNSKKNRASRDFGYITDKTSRKARNSVGGRGGRGEWARTPWDGGKAALRYAGNVREIDAFASGAAAQIVSGLQSDRKRHDWQTYWNPNIDDLKASLVYGGSSDSSQYAHYRNMLWNSFEGAYDDAGLKPQEMQKVWKTFVKKVAQKLDDYKVDVPSKAIQPMRYADRSDDVDRVYPPSGMQMYAKQIKVAQKRSFAETVKWLARATADQIAKQDHTYRDPMQDVDKGYLDGMHQDESFLASYYFGERGEYHPTAKKAIAVYRKFVGRYLQMFMELETEDRKAA